MHGVCVYRMYLLHTEPPRQLCASNKKKRKGQGRQMSLRCSYAVIIHRGFLPQDLGKILSLYNLHQHRQPDTYNWVFQKRKTHRDSIACGAKAMIMIAMR